MSSFAVIRAIVISAAAVVVGALIAGRFGAVLVGGMALWGHGAYALPALLSGDGAGASSFAPVRRSSYAERVIRTFFGLILGVALAAGAGYVYLREAKDCIGRCGDGTRCFNGRCIAAAPPTTVATAPTPKKRKRRGGSGVGPAQPELKLEPGDDRIATSGDSLGRPEHIDLSQGGDDAHELSQEDLDGVFRPAQSAISRCITDAVGDYPLESGKIEVAFRVERGGVVKKLRVTAPQLLMRRGFASCVRPVVTGLRFPSSGGASVVTYPFALQ